MKDWGLLLYLRREIWRVELQFVITEDDEIRLAAMKKMVAYQEGLPDAVSHA